MNTWHRRARVWSQEWDVMHIDGQKSCNTYDNTRAVFDNLGRSEDFQKMESSIISARTFDEIPSVRKQPKKGPLVSGFRVSLSRLGSSANKLIIYNEIQCKRQLWERYPLNRPCLTPQLTAVFCGPFRPPAPSCHPCTVVCSFRLDLSQPFVQPWCCSNLVLAHMRWAG
jgi:hypothetical protein